MPAIRGRTARQVAEIAASIREFGWTNPILVDGDNGIIAGHGRPEADQDDAAGDEDLLH